MVTARVPAEIKKRGNQVLARLGLTPSQTINALYCSLAETGSLPEFRTETQIAFANRPRTLDPELMTPEAQRMLDALRSAAELSAHIDWGEDAKRDYREIIEEGRRASYEALH
jgi:antitoxin component of RelBE/YafQ-DinJ toxin-antitoxin module